MKKATGELSATVVVLTAIGVLMAFFFYTMWPLMKSSIDASSQCNKAICETCESGDCEYVTCYPKGQYGNSSKSFKCVYKG